MSSSHEKWRQYNGDLLVKVWNTVLVPPCFSPCFLSVFLLSSGNEGKNILGEKKSKIRVLKVMGQWRVIGKCGVRGHVWIPSWKLIFPAMSAIAPGLRPLTDTQRHRGIERKRSCYSYAATLSTLIRHNPLRIAFQKTFFLMWEWNDGLWLRFACSCTLFKVVALGRGHLPLWCLNRDSPTQKEAWNCREAT